MADLDDRRGADSRVCKPWDAPYAWHPYVDQEHPGPRGIVEWLDGLSDFNRNHVEGQIDDLYDAAAMGELQDSGDEKTPIKPIHRDPELYELRMKQLTTKLRFYHGEPSIMPATLVSVHEHIKTSSREQQREISHAARRYMRGRSRYWA